MAAQTFTLTDGITVVEAIAENRYVAIPDHADYLSDAEIRAIHEVAGILRTSATEVAINVAPSSREIRVSLPESTPAFDSVHMGWTHPNGLVTLVG